MFSTLLLYLFSFLCVGWGSGLLSLLLTPITLSMGKEALGGKVDFLLNFISLLVAVIAVSWLASAFGKSPAYSLFVAPALGTICLNVGRIKEAQFALVHAEATMETERVTERQRTLKMETNNAFSDFFGMITGIVFLSPMPLLLSQ